MLPCLPMTQRYINKFNLKSQEDAAYLQAGLLAGKLTDITLTAGWDFHFLTVLLAGSEERVFFSQERLIVTKIDVRTLS